MAMGELPAVTLPPPLDVALKSLAAADMRAWAGHSLYPPLLAALAAQGFTTPTAVQEACLPAAVHGRRDIIGAAQTVRQIGARSALARFVHLQRLATRRNLAHASKRLLSGRGSRASIEQTYPQRLPSNPGSDPWPIYCDRGLLGQSGKSGYCPHDDPHRGSPCMWRHRARRFSPRPPPDWPSQRAVDSWYCRGPACQPARVGAFCAGLQLPRHAAQRSAFPQYPRLEVVARHIMRSWA